MKTTTISSLLLGALLATATAAGAQSAMSGHDAMSGNAMMGHADMATLACRTAKTGETPTAMTTDKTPLVCKKVDMAKVTPPADGTGPEMRKAWLDMLQSFHIDLNG
jgi:hypothetical protein